MAKINITLDVPNDLLPDIASGSTQLMGLIKDTGSKQIVKHLDPAKVKVSKPKTDGLLIGIGVLSAVAIGAFIANAVLKRKQAKLENEIAKQKISNHYNKVISTYLSKAQNGELELNDIENLSIFIDSLINDIKKRDVKINLSEKDISILKELLYKYTLKIYDANNIEHNNLLTTSNIENNSQKDLEIISNCLKAQQKLFCEA